MKDPTKIKWSEPVEKTDFDILIENEAAIFLKSGTLNNSDRKKLHNEITVGQQLNISNIFIINDVAMNLDVAVKLKGRNVMIIDIGDFLNKLLEIATNNKKINFKISKSGILSYAGFHAAG